MIIQILLLFGLPLIFTELARRYRAISFLGPIVLCYAAGLLLANQSFIPWDYSLAATFSEVTVPLAIPFILFASDLLGWLKLARKTVVSFMLVIFSAAAAAIIAALIFKNGVPESAKISAMLTGCYTGGTPNLMAIGLSTAVSQKTLIMVNACDMLLGGIYFFLLTTVVKWFYRKTLTKFEKPQISMQKADPPALREVFADGKRAGLKNMLLATGLAVLCAGAAVGGTFLITGEMAIAPIILIVTTLALGLSFIPKVRNITGTWKMGQYILLVFSMALGGTVEFRHFFTSTPQILMQTAVVMFGAIIIHYLLCLVFKIDSDTALITSTAGIYGPAFVGPLAESLDNSDVVIAGIISGLVGYAVGNYLGIAVYNIILLL